MAIIVPIVSAFDSRGLDKAVREIQKAKGGFDKFVAGTDAIGESFKKTGQSLSRNVTAPLAIAGAAAAKLAIDFDSSMTKIVSLVGIGATEVDGMRASVLKLAGATGKAPLELADALFVLTSAGLRGKDAISALEQSAKAGAAGLGETKDIARAVAGAINAYGSNVIDASKATDIITATARAGNFEISQFSGALGRVLPFAKQAGASLEDVGGAVALLTRTNGDAAQSVTQIQALLRAFVVPTAEATKGLKEVGLSAADLRKAVSTDGLPAALTMLDEKLGGNREQLGKILGSSEASSAAFQILDADAASLAGTFGVTADAAGLTNDAFNITADTAGFKMQKSLNDLKIVAIELGDTLVPFVESFSAAITRATESFKNMSPKQQEILVKFAALVATIGPLLILFGTLLTSVSKIIGVMGALNIALGINIHLFKGTAIAAGQATVATTIFGRAIRIAIAGTGIGLLILLVGELAIRMMGLGDETTATANKSVVAGARMRNSFAGVQDEIDATRLKNNALAKELAGTAGEARNISRSEGRNKTPIKSFEDQLKDLNLELDNTDNKSGQSASAVKAIAEAAKTAQAQIAKFSDELSKNNDILTKAKEAYMSFKDGVASVIKGIINFGDAATAETGSFLENLISQASTARAFAEKVKTLISMGLSESAIGQVLAAGAEVGTKIADEIIAGGATIVDQVNTLVSATESVANAVGESAAEQFYQSGIVAGQALVDGIRAAIAAAGFNIGSDGSITSPQADSVASVGSPTKTPAKKPTSKPTGGTAEKTPAKITPAQQGILNKLKGIPQMAAGGIVTRPTLAMIGEAGPEAIVPLSGRNSGMGNTYNINVNAGMGTNGAQVGKEIVDAIKRFEKSSGPVFASA
jgi:TP901 family phage tail tape measure protein